MTFEKNILIIVIATAGAHFSKVPKSFFTWEAIAKISNLMISGCFIDILLTWTEVLFKQEVSGAYTTLLLSADELKMALWMQNVSGIFQDKGPWGTKINLSPALPLVLVDTLH